MTYLLINYEYPPLGGGAATASKSLGDALVRKGNRVVVLTSAYRRLRGASDEDGVTVIRVPAWRTSIHRSGMIQMAAYIVSACWHASLIARKYQVDRVLAFFSIPGGAVARWLQHRRGIPYVVSLRGGDVPGTETDLHLFYGLLTGFRRNILRHARYISAPSAGLKQLSEKADPFAIRVIPNAVDCQYFRPEPRSEHSALTLLSVGRLHRQKNVSRTLEILLAVRDQAGISATARVIGDGPERQNLEDFVHRQGLDAAVSFEGWLPRIDLAAAYRSATVLVHLSSYEGLSNVVLEALASGLPVVASRIPENMELVESDRNGLLFDLDDPPPKIAQAIVRLYKSPDLWAQMSRQAREGVAARHSWDHVAEMYETGF
jgi:glycosyltransferase involved in cell wall biosynthesis